MPDLRKEGGGERPPVEVSLRGLYPPSSLYYTRMDIREPAPVYVACRPREAVLSSSENDLLELQILKVYLLLYLLLNEQEKRTHNSTFCQFLHLKNLRKLKIKNKVMFFEKIWGKKSKFFCLFWESQFVPFEDM
jgi:hypothetical protein